MAGMDGEGNEAAWHGVSAWHGISARHGTACHGMDAGLGAGVGTGLCFPSVEAGEGGVIPLFILGSWSDRNWSTSGVQQASGSGGLVLVLVPALVLPGHVGPQWIRLPAWGVEGRAGPGGIEGL